MDLRSWQLKSWQLKVVTNSYRFSIDGMRSVRLTGVDLLVLCECNETESSGPKLSKKCEASGKQTNKQNAAQLLIFGLFINQVTINQISKYFAYYANCKTKEIGNRLNN